MQGPADLSELHALYFDVLASSDSCDPTNPLCIVSPECELYTWEENRNAEDRWREKISVTHVTCTDIRDEISSTGWGLKNIYEEVSGIFEAEGEMQFSGNRGNVPTRSQQKSNATVQRSFTPVTSVKEPHKSPSSAKSQQRSNSPARSQQRSSSPANLLKRGSSPVPSVQRSFSPVGCQQRSSSPVRLHQRSSSPVWSQQRSSSPVRPQLRSSSPAWSQQSSSPVRSQLRSSSPVRLHQRSSSPVWSQQSSSPVRSHLRSSSPARLHQRSSSPVQSQIRSSSPGRLHQRSSSPARSQQSSSSSVRSLQQNSASLKTQNKESSHLRSLQKKNSPTESYSRTSTYVKEQQKCASPVRIQQRSSSPTRTQNASNLRSQQRSISPARTPLRSTSPARTPLRSTSPARTPLRSTSPARTPPRSTSPARSWQGISSTFREHQKSMSSVNLKQNISPFQSHQRSKADVGHTGNVSRRSSVPNTVSAESIDKNSPRKQHVDVSHYGANKVAQSSRACQEPPNLGVSRRLTSSTSSIDSECSQRASRTHYTTLADIPRTKRLRPDLATLNMKLRMRSPGKAEVERIFGQERRTADALEAFQALEAGLIDSLSGKYSLMEQRRARRQSTPCLYPEESVRLRQELQMRRASLHPPPRTDMGLSGSKAAGIRSRDPSPYRTGTQGRTTFQEPEWINRDKILRPVGAQDKKEERMDRNTELAWKNRDTFLKSTPLPIETSHEHPSSTHFDRRSRESHQTSISRISAETTFVNSGSSQYQKPERSHKSEHQNKPSPTTNPESYYTGSNPHKQQHPSYGSLLENEQLYNQSNSIQETKNVGWSQYKPAGPLSCHTPEPQKQQFLGFSEIETLPVKTEMKATSTQTDREMSVNNAVPRVAYPQESNNIKSQDLSSLSNTKLPNVEEPSLFPWEHDKSYAPPETMKRELQRIQTSSPNSSSSPKPYSHSVEPNHCNLKDLQKSTAPEITHNDLIGLPNKTSPMAESLVFNKPESQHAKTEKSQTKGITELNIRESPNEDNNVQQSHSPPPPSSSPDQEQKYHPGRSLYKPAGPLSCYRPEPNNQILVEWYSGTESPLSKVVLKSTRTITDTSMNVTSDTAQQSDKNNAQSLETQKQSKSQDILDGNQCPSETRSRPQTPSQHLTKEPAEIKMTPINSFQKGDRKPPYPENISNGLKGLNLADASEMLHSELAVPRAKTPKVNDDPSLIQKSPTKGITHVLHCEYSSVDSHAVECEEAGDTDMYLNTMADHRKPDLLNFKKGWMSLLDTNGEWKKHWFVLTDSSLRYYRDSNAEEADELDGEIDLRTCTDVPEYAVQRNYGFQIHTNEGVFTLSAMTSGIRRNWIEALRKNVHPVSIPDVTKLSESNKENAFVPTRQNQRPDELRLGSEVRTRKVELAGPRQGSFDYVELSPLSPGEERDQRSEERRRWFEAPPVGDSSTRRITQASLTEEQKQRLGEDIEAKWKELERLPLRETKQASLTCLLGGSRSKAGGENTAALEKQIQSLKMQLEKAKKEIESQKGGGEGALPRGYISQEACELSLSQMESSHKQLLSELQRHHEWEIQRLRQEKDQLLAEEAAATASVIEAIRAAHKEELQREVEKARTFQHGGSSGNEMLRRQHQSDMEALRRELQTLSERYSQKCLEIGALNQNAAERDKELQRYQQEVKELLRQNQDLNSRLSEEIGKLRSFMAGNGPSEGRLQAGEKNSAELEVLLRVKENELQYLRKEVSCLREDLQNMQKDKRYASEKYKDIYVELNNIKSRSEREIDQLKEHLRLAMAALREGAAMRNSVGE